MFFIGEGALLHTQEMLVRTKMTEDTWTPLELSVLYLCARTYVYNDSAIYRCVRIRMFLAPTYYLIHSNETLDNLPKTRAKGLLTKFTGDRREYTHTVFCWM